MQSEQVEELVCLISSLDRTALMNQLLEFSGNFPVISRRSFSTLNRPSDSDICFSHCACKVSVYRKCSLPQPREKMRLED